MKVINADYHNHSIGNPHYQDTLIYKHWYEISEADNEVDPSIIASMRIVEYDSLTNRVIKIHVSNNMEEILSHLYKLFIPRYETVSFCNHTFSIKYYGTIYKFYNFLSYDILQDDPT